MICKTRGIVFHHLKYNDTSLIATIYTESYGRKSFLVKGVYKSRPLIKANLFQPLSLLQLEISLAGNRDLQRIREVTTSSPLLNIYSDFHKQCIVFFIAEFLNKAVREEEANSHMFEFLYNCVQYLDTCETDFSNFHLIFLIQLSKFLGFLPKNNFSSENIVFDVLRGYFIPDVGANVNTYSKRLSEKMSLLLKLNFETSSQLAINRVERMELLQMLLDFYGLHLHSKLNIQSLKILKEMND